MSLVNLNFDRMPRHAVRLLDAAIDEQFVCSGQNIDRTLADVQRDPIHLTQYDADRRTRAERRKVTRDVCDFAPRTTWTLVCLRRHTAARRERESDDPKRAVQRKVRHRVRQRGT